MVIYEPACVDVVLVRVHPGALPRRFESFLSNDDQERWPAGIYQ